MVKENKIGLFFSDKVRALMVVLLLGSTFMLVTPFWSVLGIILMWWGVDWPVRDKVVITIGWILSMTILPLFAFTYFLILVVASYLFIRMYLVGEAVVPTSRKGEYLVVSWKKGKQWLQKGDRIIVRGKGNNNLLIQRIVGLPGDIITRRDGMIYCNEQPLRGKGDEELESFLDSNPKSPVPKNSYLVRSDNTTVMVSKESIVSKLKFYYE